MSNFWDTSLGGVFKVVWIIGLVFLPFLTAFVYIITRGEGMAARQQAAVQRAKAETDSYIRQVAEQIADEKELLDAGTINAEEYASLKAKALA